MQTTSAAVSPFLPSFSAWQEEARMDALMAGLAKLAFTLPAILLAVRLFCLHG